jgi:hypothetical protein
MLEQNLTTAAKSASVSLCLRPDLSGNAALDAANRDDARRGGVVLSVARTLVADVVRSCALGKRAEGAGEP